MPPETGAELTQAFRELRGGLLSYLRKRVGDADVAQDLLQETFLKALAAGERQRPADNVAGWLYAIARNAVADFYRRRRPTEPLDADNWPAARPDDDVLRELAACLRPLAQGLPEIYRDTLLASDFEGKTMRSLASARGVSLSAIKSRASRARRLLKKRLLECCDIGISRGGIEDYRARRPSACCPDGGCGENK